MGLQTETEDESGTLKQAIVADARALFLLGIVQVLRDIAPRVTIQELESFEALAAALALQTPNLVVLGLELDDLILPDSLEAVVRLAPKCRLIVVSERIDARLASLCFDAGAKGYLPTGLGREDAAKAIRRVLAGGEYLPQALRDRASFGKTGTTGHQPALGGASGATEPALTGRQMDLLRLLAAGRSNNELARMFGLDEGAVRGQISAILKVFGMGNPAEVHMPGGEPQAH